MRKILIPALFAAIVSAFAGPQGQEHHPEHDEWNYEGRNGPEHWGELDPSYRLCNEGRQQSPIDIELTQKLQTSDIHFEYKKGPVKIINNGHTAVRVNYAPGNGNFLMVGDKRYELRQFHFHRPSEEYVHGQLYEMSIHFMHEAADDGKIAAVAMLLRAGRANETVEELWKYMPKTAGQEHGIPGVQIDPARLLPPEGVGGYYIYSGSLTAPPCTEGVTWIVLKTPMEVSRAEINAFASLYPHNVRPLQSLNGRTIMESQ